MNMKRTTIMAVASLLTLAGCNNTPTDNSQQAIGSATEQTANHKPNIVKKHINIPAPFSYITNLGSIDIIYTQGDYSIDVEGDSTMLQYINITFDSNLLTAGILTDNNTDLNRYGNTSNVRMYVSCPDLKCVSICGNGNFESRATWTTEDLQLGVLGTGAMNLEAIVCTKFRLQSTDIGNITIHDLTADDATLYSRSSAHIEAHVNVNTLTVLNDGKQTIKLTGKANSTSISNPKDENLINELQ